MGGAILLYVGLVRYSTRFRGWVLTPPLRTRDGGALSAQTRQLVRQGSLRHAEGEHQRPGDLLGDLLRLRGDVTRPRPWDQWTADLRAWLDRATRPDSARRRGSSPVPTTRHCPPSGGRSRRRPSTCAGLMPAPGSGSA